MAGSNPSADRSSDHENTSLEHDAPDGTVPYAAPRSRRARTFAVR